MNADGGTPHAGRRPRARSLMRLGALGLVVAAASVLVALAMPSSPHALQQLRGGSTPGGALIFVAAARD